MPSENSTPDNRRPQGQGPGKAPDRLKLEDGSRVAVIGGGPAGSFFSYFLLQMAQRIGLKIQLDIYEWKDFASPGPKGCNMCGGIISETLVQNLAAEGIHLPASVVQRSLDSYFLHMDVGSVRIETPLREKRIAAVHRGGGPRGITQLRYDSFDGFLLGLAARQGARVVPSKVEAVAWENGRPQLKIPGAQPETYDLLAVASGVNATALKLLEALARPGAYQPPKTTKAYICEYFLGRQTIRVYLGSAMHVFLLDLPRLDFAALIPKGDYVTLCLLGDDIDKEMVETFLKSPQVKECLPPNWQAPDDFCHCFPRLNIEGAAAPFADRVVFLGDCGVTRLYKDGIGAAYRTSKAAARAALFSGLSGKDFRRQYLPACRKIARDNQIGKFVFAVTRIIQKLSWTRRGVWRMVVREQRAEGKKKRMSTVLWDTFTGSAPYREVLLLTLHPFFVGQFLRHIVAGFWPKGWFRRKRGTIMISGISGVLGKVYREGEVIIRQGDVGDCMYVIQRGEAEVLRREGEKEFCMGVLGAEDFFGEMALFGQEVRSATVRALTDVWVLSLEKRNFLQRAHEDPSLAFRLLEGMSKRVQELERQLIHSAPAA